LNSDGINKKGAAAKRQRAARVRSVDHQLVIHFTHRFWIFELVTFPKIIILYVFTFGILAGTAMGLSENRVPHSFRGEMTEMTIERW
jgi:hypothetical protein